ncbi:MAG: FHA domain-containing protein [Wenzhouxiangella sp.]|nr:FHA domain-containing protein [Wenzhouxiangella sp.]
MELIADNARRTCGRLFGLVGLSGPPFLPPPDHREHWLLGRAANCDLVLAEASISRLHARFDRRTGVIEDLSSGAGIEVNGQRVLRQTLATGDRIRLGSWQFAVIQPEQPPAGLTIQRAMLDASLAAPRLDLLLAFCERVNGANTTAQVEQALLEAALAGSGYSRAMLVSLDLPSCTVIRQLPEQAGPARPSRLLLEAARDGGVVELSHIHPEDLSASIQARRLIAATAVALTGSGGSRSALYLDARAGEASARADTARYCQALAQMAQMALDRLDHEKALWQQRERIYADLHDDLGARLLNLIYRAPTPAMADEARIMLDDLRDVVSRPSLGRQALAALIAELRHEAHRRLDAAGIKLGWTECGPAIDPGLAWSSQAAALLSRCLREMLSNALRHATPSRVAIAVRHSDEQLIVSLRHNGRFQPPEAWTRGRGTRSLVDRARALSGTISWQILNDELEARLQLPLEPGE